MQRRMLLRCATLLAVALLTLSGCANKQTAPVSKETVSATGESVPATEESVPATEEYVRLIGRTCTKNDVTWLPQSGSAVEFVFSGSRLAIDMVADDSVENESDRHPRFAVLVDDAVVLDDTMDESARTVEVFSDDPTKSATVKVIHLSEANTGAVGIRSITIESSESKPIVPSPAKDLSIGFVGDSITCAYGVEAASSDEPFTTKKENFMKSYAYLTAEALEADYETVCYSGFGVVSGWSADGTRNNEMLVPPLYDVVAKDYDKPWDFSSHPHDVVVINLGTNDFTYTGTDANRMQEFRQAYGDFLTQVRECNPKSLIICTMGTMGGTELYPYIEQAVEDVTAKTGDDRIVCYLSDPIDVESDGVGTNGHPNAISQQKIADALVEVISKQLNI